MNAARNGSFAKGRSLGGRLASLFAGRRTALNRQREARGKPQVEALEGRQVLSSIVPWTDGNVYILGSPSVTNAAMVVQHSSVLNIAIKSADSPTVLVQQFPVSQVKSVVFIGGSAADSFLNNSYTPSIAYGNGGNDQLIGGGGNDYLSGGDGNDVLLGRSGNDTLLGNAGNDVLDGGTGYDYLDGGSSGYDFDVLYDDYGMGWYYGDSLDRLNFGHLSPATPAPTMPSTYSFGDPAQMSQVVSQMFQVANSSVDLMHQIDPVTGMTYAQDSLLPNINRVDNAALAG